MKGYGWIMFVAAALHAGPIAAVGCEAPLGFVSLLLLTLSAYYFLERADADFDRLWAWLIRKAGA